MKKELHYLKKAKISFEAQEIVRALSQIVEEKGPKVYLVGGFVRDLILGEPLSDMDVVIEGESRPLAMQLAKKLKGKVHSHGEFGTFVVFLPTGVRVDIATARKEMYPAPASLPRVEKGSLMEDLGRRDFTLNALAVPVTPRGFGNLIDPYGGLEDLRKGRLRAFHSRSFIDDPTRLFRALRYQTRLQLELEKSTKEWMRESVQKGLPRKLSGKRLFSELERVVAERRPLPVLLALDHWNLLRFFDRSIRFREREVRMSHRLERCIQRPLADLRLDEVWLLIVLNRLPRGRIAPKAREWALHRRLKKRLHQIHDAPLLFRKLQKGPLKPSEIYRILSPYAPEGVLFFYAAAPTVSVGHKIRRYLFDWRSVRLGINGDDIKRIGLQPGPQYRKVLDALRDEKLDREITSRSEELEWLKQNIDRF